MNPDSNNAHYDFTLLSLSPIPLPYSSSLLLLSAMLTLPSLSASLPSLPFHPPYPLTLPFLSSFLYLSSFLPTRQDIFEAQDENGNEIVLKVHRLGRTSFRAVRRQRDYMQGKSKASWLFMSRLAGKK